MYQCFPMSYNFFQTIAEMIGKFLGMKHDYEGELTTLQSKLHRTSRTCTLKEQGINVFAGINMPSKTFYINTERAGWKV